MNTVRALPALRTIHYCECHSKHLGNKFLVLRCVARMVGFISLLLCCFVLFFERVSLCVALGDLKFALGTRLASN